MNKVMIFIPSLSGGGAERTIVNIIKYIDKTKYKVILVMIRDITKGYQENKYINLIEEKCEVIYLDCKLNKLSVLNIILKLSSCIKKEKPNILFSTIYKANIVTYFSNILSGTKTPLILRESNNRTEEGISWLAKKFITYTYNRADRIIALSNGVSEDLINNFYIIPKKIKVIYNPVDIKEIQSLSDQPINEQLVDDGEKMIVSVGRLFEQKDFPTLIKAFKSVTEKTNAKLIILGQGPLKEQLENLTNELNIKDKVQFLGFKINPYKYMKEADIFVLSSKYEGFGHVLAEAMAVGTPVISADCKSGPGEVLSNGLFGQLFEVGNHDELAQIIYKMLIDDDLKNKLKNIGFERSKSFDANKIVKEYEEVFEDVC